MTPILKLIFVGTVFIVIVGCHKRDDASPPAQSEASPTTFPTGSATVRGSVVLVGKAPTMSTIPNKPCHDGALPLNDEAVVVDDAGHLKNVIVYLENAPPAPPAENAPAEKLDQINCQYVPHMLALRTGQPLHVTTADPTLHNVHGDCLDNPPFNFALVAPTQSRDLTFKSPERFPIRCDVHPWMKAYVQVFSHPWFAVTDKNGAFEIPNVPPGTYTLVAWQEKYGFLRQPIHVENNKTTTQTFEFKSGL
ncbi:MAG TPA: carboxypeptidase regulatory-like domain-containing protein [Tepidisphaeraceae bacterium]